MATDRTERMFNYLVRSMKHLREKEIEMGIDFARLSKAVEDNNSAIGSIEALVTTLAKDVADLKTSQTDPATAAKIDELAANLENQSAQIRDYVVANTPIPPAPPPAPEPVPPIPVTVVPDPNAPPPVDPNAPPA